ncbi:LysE family translocator [Actinomadura sp. DC4]|uniref:LysE family translocator n=1 Tax=Actinomadura sp. DC4 TaxID=3055069 RepID=UPI0025B0ED3D|nr:LysE family translocator [Actinomadura sp. DC4]MDN3356291.1 LysE family translocator [Actinomadura sp. DC4]
MLQTLLAFVGAAAVVALVPGPSTAIIVRQSVTEGRRAGVAAMLGNECGVVLWGLAAALGLSALLLASTIAYDAMRIAGAVFLLTLGARALWRSRRPAAVAFDEPPSRTGSAWRAFRVGLLTNVANPKAGVFAVSFLPQFVPAGASVLPVLVALSLVWALIDAVWYLTLIWLAGRAGRALGRPSVRRRLEQVSGVVLVGLGLRLAAESR